MVPQCEIPAGGSRPRAGLERVQWNLSVRRDYSHFWSWFLHRTGRHVRRQVCSGGVWPFGDQVVFERETKGAAQIAAMRASAAIR
jgi:hypothetical protein